MRFIAHAGGSIDGNVGTNSLEALDYNYKRGFRLFELDILETSDNNFVAVHDWDRWSKLTGLKITKCPSQEEFLKHPILGKYTPMNLEVINNWFQEHPDAILVTDKINEPKRFSELFVDKKRLMMELFSEDAVEDGLRNGVSVMISDNVLANISEDRLLTLRKKGLNYASISRHHIRRNKQLVKRLNKLKIKAYVFHLNRPKFIDEDYVLRYELSYVFGMYADNWIK